MLFDAVRLDITVNVCAWGTCIADPICEKLSKMLFKSNIEYACYLPSERNGKKAVHTKHAKNNAHFDGSTTIRTGSRSAWACLKHMPQIACAVHNGTLRQFIAVWTCAYSSVFPVEQIDCCWAWSNSQMDPLAYIGSWSSLTSRLESVNHNDEWKGQI